MPPFGVHTSIAGGVANGIANAVRLGCDTFQIFTASPQSWPIRVPNPAAKTATTSGQPSANNDRGSAKPFADCEAKEFRKLLLKSRLKFPTAHDSYLINLASPDPALWRKSVEGFVDELIRAEALELKYLVAHPGAHIGCGEETGIANVARAIDETHSRCPDFRVKILLELTAGQGTCLGCKFDHLAAILKRIAQPRRVGVCFDTCHVFAAGYRLFPQADYENTIREFDRVIGLRRLKLFHLNDSKKPFGSRVDRHEHIGKGCLGLEPFRFIVNDPRFQKTPMILETPKHDADGNEMDPVNLATLRGLIERQRSSG
jgi:deoxyribonuclease IV